MKHSSPTKTKLRIGLVFDDSLDSNDGVQQYVKTLGRWLIREGHHVKFLVGETHDAGELQPHVYSLSRNIKVSGNENKMFLPFFSKGADIDAVLEAEEFDVLHVMMPTNPLMGSRVIKRAGMTPVVGTFHMVGGTRFINFGARLMRIAQASTWNRIDTFLSVSTAAKSFERKYFGRDSVVSPNMVDMATFARGETQEFLRGNNGTIIFLGRLVERKGAIHLLEALRILHQQGDLQGVRVHICGDGELRGELEDFVKRHQLHENIMFHGFIAEEEKGDYLASADIAVYPATGGEAFGIVLIEAMSTGKSVVLGGDNSGYRTVLGKRPELLFDPYNHDTLAHKLHHFLNDEKARQHAIKWQLEEVRQYDTEAVGREMVKIYHDAIQSKHTPSEM